MKKPWDDKTGLAKAAAVLATVFGIALGLCGVSAFAVPWLDHVEGPISGLRNSLGIAVYVLGMLELAAMILSLAGLLLVGIIAAVRGVGRVYSGVRGKSEED